MKLTTKLYALALSASFLTTLHATDPYHTQKPATMKVLLQRKAPESLIEVKGRYQVIDTLTGTLLSSGMMNKRYLLTSQEYGLQWGEKFPGIHQIRILPADTQSSILVNGTQYKGCVDVYEKNGLLSVVNEVDTESYLKSTLTAQFTQPLNEEVMNALAIVARTNAYFTALKNKNSLWHVDAKETHYEGNALVGLRSHVTHAVEKTRHAILTFKDSPFAATWTQNSAGKTVDFASLFRKALVTPSGVQAPLAAREREQHRWTFTMPKEAFAKSVQMHDIAHVDLYLADHSDKVYAVKLSDGASTRDVDFFTLQKALGATRLRSTEFKVALKENEIVFTGYGEGPGTGLCLYSAQAMAARGDAAPKILAAFFPETQLEKARAPELLKGTAK